MLIPPAILALAPLILVGVLLVGFRWPAWRAMAIGLIATYPIAAYWQTPSLVIAAATIKGLAITASIAWIIFGAIFLLETLRATGMLDAMRNGLTGISPDRRVQAIVVAWLFGGLLEGSAGFGTPAVVCVPLLIVIGFPPLAAVLTGMLIQSAPVSFGALGTPIVIGVATSLSDAPEVAVWAEQQGMTFGQLLHDVGWRVAIVHSLIGSFMPLLICCLLTGRFGPARRYRDGLNAWKAALAAAVVFAICSTTTAYFLGPEFPTIVAASVGLAVLVPLFRAGWFVPKETFDFPPQKTWPTVWTGSFAIAKPIDGHDPDEPMVPDANRQAEKHSSAAGVFAWWPYVAVVGLLVLTRLPSLPFSTLLKDPHVTLSTGELFGTEISASITPLYLPGTIFVIVGFLALLVSRPKDSAQPFRAASHTTLKASTVLAFSVPLVQVFLNTGVNTANLPPMPIAVAESASNLFGSAWPFVSPFVGGFGAFLAGSNTISNMMFALPQFEVARLINASPLWIVALQAVGGAAGNTICVHNVVAACAVGGLFGREGDVIRVTGVVFLVYATLAGLIGLAVS